MAAHSFIRAEFVDGFARHSRLINVISGLLLVGIAVYDLALNWGMLRLFFFHRP